MAMALTDQCPSKISDAVQGRFYHGHRMNAKTTSLMRPLCFLLILPVLSSILAAAEPPQPLFRTVDLDIDETQ